jgi:hypothetical protein
VENQVLSDDMLVGSQAIAEYIGEDPRKTFLPPAKETASRV